MQRADQADLQRLHDASASVYALVTAGTSPDDAVVKVAGDQGFTRNWTERLCEVTNRLMAVDHLERATPEKRASDHPLVDTEAVLARRFPTAVETLKAASGRSFISGPVRYADLPTTTKAASGATHAIAAAACSPLGGSNRADVLHRAQALMRTLKQASADRTTALSDATYRIAGLAKQAAAAVESSGVKLRDLEERATAWFGNDAKQAFDVIAARCADRSRFSGEPRAFTTNPWGTEPFKQAAEVIIACRQEALNVQTHVKLAEIAGRVADQVAERIRGVAAAERPATEKQAFGLGDLKGLTSPPQKPNAQGGNPADAALAGLTPEDVQFLNSIKAREALVAALRDPVIARNDLSQVTKTYNRFSDAAPRAFMNEASLVTLLRSALEHPDQGPHDLQQMQNVEKGLASHQNPLDPNS